MVTIEEVSVHRVLSLAEVTKLKMQLAVPGSAGTYTSAADRKLEEGQRVRYCLLLISLPLLLDIKMLILNVLLPEPVSAAPGSAETWYRPAVWWTSLLSQHRRREAAAGPDRCRWEISQTGTNTKMQFKSSVNFLLKKKKKDSLMYSEKLFLNANVIFKVVFFPLFLPLTNLVHSHPQRWNLVT